MPNASLMHSSAVPLPLASGISRSFLLRHRICPLAEDGEGQLVVAVGENASSVAIAEVAELYGRRAASHPCSREELEQYIERITTEADRLVALDLVRDDDPDDERTTDVRDLANGPPVIRYVNLLLREAIDAGASDIHLEARKGGLDVRFRMDGVLAPAPEPPRQMEHAVVSRIKTVAELDIAERRRPQDGRIRLRLVDRELDLRVSTVPTVHGESVVLRLLDRGVAPGDLDSLGMPAAMLDAVRQLVSRPHGLILVTGPTGSGKTTTLYAALQQRDASREKIITVEDPVEYELQGVTQVPVHRQSGVAFATALRAILRQDPDVVMIGEMRDRETAEVAIQAAMTGHLVLSTLHTNDAVGALPRLLDLGIADYLIGGTLEGIVAQRLVRRICGHCSVRVDLSDSDAARLVARPIHAASGWRGLGCSACRESGYRGRIGIFEVLQMTDALRAALARGAPRSELAERAIADGMVPMRECGWQLVQAGITTIEEVLRAVQE